MLKNILSKEELKRLYQLSQQDDGVEALELFFEENDYLATKIVNHYEESGLIPLEILNGDGYDPSIRKNKIKMTLFGDNPSSYVIRRFLTGDTNELTLSYKIVFEGE